MTVLSLSGVSVSYPGQDALLDIDLDIQEGERVALVGPSGAGKSTLLKLCNGSAVQTHGRVEVLGHNLRDISGLPARKLRARVGVIHQQLNLIGPLRVIHNVNAGRLGTWGAAKALFSLIRPLEADAARHALRCIGIENKIRERTDRLSGGEQQRVALARVLVQEPDLILADEPVSSLDPGRSEEVMRLLTEVVTVGRRTLVVSLHNFDIARRSCDRVIGLRDGRLLFDLKAGEVTDQHRAALYRIEP